MSRPVLLRWIQKPIRIAVPEFDETPVRQNCRLMDPLSVNVSVSIRMTGCQRGNTIRICYHAVAGLDVGAVQLQRNTIRRTNLQTILSIISV